MGALKIENMHIAMEKFMFISSTVGLFSQICRVYSVSKADNNNKS